MNSTDVRRQWADRSGEFSPAYYAYYGPNETSESIRTILERVVGRNASVLELGCSSGRHLAHLYDSGFDSLEGIDVNEDAVDVMREVYPDLAVDGTFHVGAIEDVVTTFDDDRFDAVYSVQTLQHLHPDLEWVFEDLARIASDLLVTAEIEGDESEGEGEGDREHDDRGTDDDFETDRDESGPDVTYVTDDVPLYYRNWNEIFTDFGFVESEARVGDRETLRMFRPSE